MGETLHTTKTASRSAPSGIGSFTEAEHGHGHGYVEDETPELAIAVVDGFRGCGRRAPSDGGDPTSERRTAALTSCMQESLFQAVAVVGLGVVPDLQVVDREGVRAGVVAARDVDEARTSRAG